jgi:DNA invertase Pin-like site-specific DNA recombinase
VSQRHEGWQLISTKYDDGGFSGGTMERPALKRLLEDIAAKRVDNVVVSKVDRLTRSLADFAKIVEQFDKQGISFVSVTQQFNTTTSMGRLTLNVLLSFAQFEREVTGERIRDKIAASKRKGMWMGGVVPLGYDLNDRHLVLNSAEADQVKEMYRTYLRLGCVTKLQAYLKENGIRSKRRVSRIGRALITIICNEDASHSHMPDYAISFDGSNVRFTNRKTVKGLPSREHTIFPILDAETYHDARTVAPGYDVHWLELEWRNFWVDSGKPELKSPDAAFIGFCKNRYTKKPNVRMNALSTNSSFL